MVLKIAQSLAFGALLLILPNIQAAPQDNWYQERESFYHGEGWHMRLFDRVRDDLDRVQQTDFKGRDQFRIARTKDELNDLQTKLADHMYDQPQLDEVIGSLNRVLASNRLSQRDRDMLSDDLVHLRDYREHHADWR